MPNYYITEMRLIFKQQQQKQQLERPSIYYARSVDGFVRRTEVFVSHSDKCIIINWWFYRFIPLHEVNPMPQWFMTDVIRGTLHSRFAQAKKLLEFGILSLVNQQIRFLIFFLFLLKYNRISVSRGRGFIDEIAHILFIREFITAGLQYGEFSYAM